MPFRNYPPDRIIKVVVVCKGYVVMDEKERYHPFVLLLSDRDIFLYGDGDNFVTVRWKEAS